MSYIGNSPGVASQRVTTTITATAGQTQFTTLSGYILGYVDVYLNGAKLINGVDFEAITGTYITLFTGAVVNDVVELVSYVPRGLTDGYTKAEADAKFLDVTGDIATGTLSIKNTTLSAQNDSVANWAYTSTLSSITNPNDIYFKPDGLKMFVTTASVITQYALTTAWDTTTATAGTTFSMSAIDTGTLGLFFSPDGTKMVTCGTSGVVIANGSGVAGEDRAYYFTLSTAWDVTTATLVNSIRFAIGDAGGIPAALTSPQAVDFNSDGTIMYIQDSTIDYVNQFALSTAYNVNTATYTKRLGVSTEEGGGTALRFNSAGTRMYLVGSTGDDVNEYRLTTAWDIATAVYYDKFYLGWYELTPSGLYISESANAAFICGVSSDVVLKFLTDKYALQLSAETASGKIDLVGNTRVENNFAVDGDSYFDGTIVTGSTLSIGSTFTGANITANQISTTTSAITLGGSVSTGATALTTTQTTGTITVGGTAATGAITLGQSTAAQTLNLGTGATATATTKTINIGTAGLSGSTTAIQIGSAVSGATNTITINGDTTISGLTVGKGAGAVATNTAVGASALAANTTGLQNTAVGQLALRDTTTGQENTVVGRAALYQNTTGSANTAIGVFALSSNTTASENTAVGYQSAYSNTTGTKLVAVGHFALTSSVTGTSNVAVGWGAAQLTTGSNNTTVGDQSLRFNTSGQYNTAVGSAALNANTTSDRNTAVGYQSLYSNTTAPYNTAVGAFAGYTNSTGTRNAFMGYASGYSNTTGSYNTALGDNAGYQTTTGSYNTSVGMSALGNNTTASGNTAVGYTAGFSNTSGAQNVYIGQSSGYYNQTGTENTFVGFSANGNGTGGSAGSYNTAVGRAAMNNNYGSYNTAVGTGALQLNTSASNNTAVGYQAGYTGATAANVTAIGFGALYLNTVSDNTAVGFNALNSNSTGAYNTAVGGRITGSTSATLQVNTTGSYNSALGAGAMATNTTGSYNSAIGVEALRNNTTASNNTAVGYQAGYINQTGGDNTFLGKGAGYGSANGYNGNTAIGFGAGGLLGAGGNYNTFLGVGAGGAITTGSSNTIVGAYSGNQGGLNISTASNNVVLSDGAGTVFVHMRTDSTKGATFYPSVFVNNGNSNGSQTYTGAFNISVGGGYSGNWELSLGCFQNNGGAYGVGMWVYHVGALAGYPYGAWAPTVTLISSNGRNLTGGAPGISVTSSVNGVVTVTFTGTGDKYYGWAIRNMNYSPAA